MSDNIIPRIRDILASHRMTAAESFALTRLVVDAAEKTTTTADRERIAELERDLAHARLLNREATQVIIDEIGSIGPESIDSATRRVVESLRQARRLLDTYAVTVMGDFGGDMTTTATEVAPVLAPAAVEEQGPWVVYDVGPSHEGLKFCGRTGWTDTSPLAFSKRTTAQDIIDDFGSGNEGMRVITLAEARAIDGAK